MYIHQNANMFNNQMILYNQYVLGSLQFAEEKPGKFGMVRKSSAMRYFVLPRCGAMRYKVLVMAHIEG